VSQAITMRNFRWDDLEGVMKVMNGASASFGDLRRWTLEELRFALQNPLEQPEQNYFVAVAPDGQIIGMSECYYEADAHTSYCFCYLLPSHRGRGVGTRLFEWSEMRLMTLMQPDIDAHTDDLPPLIIKRVIDSQDAAGIDLIGRAGYHYARSFYTMVAELGEQHDAPLSLPDGIVIRRYDPAHLTLYYETHQETFEDHWGSHREPYDEWERELVQRVGSDPTSYWQSAWDGDQIAGVVLARPFGDENDLGWLSILGVRRAYRRRGVGDALLRATFAAFRTQGFARVGLGVDASSLTNAVALYERAGMAIKHRRDVYQRVVGGAIPITG
jgi:ribosomal protein S18 acetylase RimI-like enzyme